jgi:hypothetical protein
MDLSDGSTSIPEEKELPLIKEPVDSQILGHFTGFPVVPATPVADSLNKLMPMSPLTPIPETPFPGPVARDTDATNRYGFDTGWSKNLFGEVSPPKAHIAIFLKCVSSCHPNPPQRL